MPKPKPGQSQDDFVAMCVPMVLDEGTAKDQDQAVAICNSMYEEHGKQAHAMGPGDDESESDWMGRCVSEMESEGKDKDEAQSACETMWQHHQERSAMVPSRKEELHVNEGESQSEFIDRCVAKQDGMDESEARAACQKIWEHRNQSEQRPEASMHESFVARIKGRRNSISRFGYGITTAEPYVRALLQMEESGCSTGRTCSVESLLKEAQSRLCCSTPHMTLESIATAKDLSLGRLDGIGVSGLEPPPKTLMLLRHVVTTDKQDRDGDVLETAGFELDPAAPLLWQHQPFLPIGKVLREVEHTAHKLTVISALLDMNELTHDAAVLFEADALRFSHGFRVLDYDAMMDEKGAETGSFRIKRAEGLEVSGVSVPSNTDAVVELWSRGKFESDVVRSYAKHYASKRPVQVRGIDIRTKHVQPFNMKKIQSEFHPEHQRAYAAVPVHDWASQWLECEVKDLYITSTFAPYFAMGNFLSAMKIAMDSANLRDTRNLDDYGHDWPIKRETVQLNSKKSDTFIVNGFQFWTCDNHKCCLDLQRYHDGLEIRRYDVDDRGVKFFEDCWEWVRENNYLKGEAFRLGGGFIERKGQSLDEIFLVDGNKIALKRAVKLASSGTQFASRGMIFLGPPGTGKTLSARALLNNTDATFIWVSAKDMYGASSISMAFKIAGELAPSIICFEDIDSFFSDYAFDLLKTELDGLDKRTGVLTLLTTNYPAMLPETLIDRPGRFHDVLQFDLPDEHCRRDMFRVWSASASNNLIEDMVKRTAGFSGAHIKDLCSFADVLRRDDDMQIDEALEKAYGKVSEQRRLVRGLSSQQRMRRDYSKMDIAVSVLEKICPACAKRARAKGFKSVKLDKAVSAEMVAGLCDAVGSDPGFFSNCMEFDFGEFEGEIGSKEGFCNWLHETCGFGYPGEHESAVVRIKAGRVISQKNMDLLGEVRADLEELSGMEMARAAKALCERCASKVQSVIESAKPAEEPEGKSVCMGHVHMTVDDMEPLITDVIKKEVAAKQPDLTDVVNFVLGASQDDLARVKHTLDLVVDLTAYNAAAEEYRAFERSIDL